MFLFLICPLLMVGAPSNSHKMFGRLDADTLGRVSSFLTETASARVFRRVASNCNQGHRQQVHDKMDQFKSLLEQIEDELPRTIPAFAQKIHSLHRELRMSGLFAFEGPVILRRWIAKMRVPSTRNQREKIPIVMAAIPGLFGMEESANEGTKGFVDLLIENSHRIFQDLVTPHFEELSHRAAALLLHEYLFWTVHDSDWVGGHQYSTDDLPEMSNIFGCDGIEREVLRHLVENRGLILIHPFHWESMWRAPAFVHNRRLVDQICDYGTQWVHNKKMSYEQSGRSAIAAETFLTFQTEFPTLVLIKAIENVREPLFWRQGVRAEHLRNHIEWLANGQMQEDAPLIPRLFDVLMKRDVVALSIALRDIMTNNHHIEVFAQDRSDHLCRIHCKLLGTAVDVLISGQLKTVERWYHIQSEWPHILSCIAMRWVREYRLTGANFMYGGRYIFGLMAWEERLLFDDEALRMSEENLRKIQEAFPWLMPESFVQTVLLAQQERMARDLREGTTYDHDSVLSFYPQ